MVYVGPEPDFITIHKDRVFNLKRIFKHHYGIVPLLVLLAADLATVCMFSTYMLITRDIQFTRSQVPYHMAMDLLNPTKLKLIRPWVTSSCVPRPELHELYGKMKSKDLERRRKLKELAESGNF